MPAIRLSCSKLEHAIATVACMNNSLIRRLFSYWTRPRGTLRPAREVEDKPNCSNCRRDASDQPIREKPYRWIAKRSFDIVAAIVGLIIFSPTLLLALVAIKFDSRGPAFRRHVRYAYNGEEIQLLKFRTNHITRSGRQSRSATRIGRALRSAGVDELPQLINVLCGEMSIVGPEPLSMPLDGNLRDSVPRQLRRTKLKPGLIGWAQVNGCWRKAHGHDAMQRRIHYDLHYIEHCSFFLDMKILAMAAFPTIHLQPSNSHR